jgi:nucleoside-diphosphate kinase
MAIERTLIVVKPDGMERNLIGEIIKRYEGQGLKVVGMKMVKVTKDFAEKHYTAHEQQILGMGNKTLSAAKESGGGMAEVKQIFKTDDPAKIGMTLREWMVKFMISSPVVAFVLEGENAVAKVRKITGFTDPSKAEKGTIRGDLGKDTIIWANNERRATKNLVHASGSVDEAKSEIAMWFKSDEIFKR